VTSSWSFSASVFKMQINSEGYRSAQIGYSRFPDQIVQVLRTVRLWKIPLVSRPAGLHHRPLAEPDVSLSTHPAPIKQTRQSNGLSVARIEVLLFPVASVMRPLDPTPSLQPHYEPSSLLRVGPPQCSASVRSPRGFRRLGFSLNIRATGSCSSTRQPASASRPLYAGRRPLRHQAPSGLVPGAPYSPGFDDS